MAVCPRWPRFNNVNSPSLNGFPSVCFICLRQAHFSEFEGAGNSQSRWVAVRPCGHRGHRACLGEYLARGGRQDNGLGTLCPDPGCGCLLEFNPLPIPRARENLGLDQPRLVDSWAPRGTRSVGTGGQFPGAYMVWSYDGDGAPVEPLGFVVDVIESADLEEIVPEQPDPSQILRINRWNATTLLNPCEEHLAIGDVDECDICAREDPRLHRDEIQAVPGQSFWGRTNCGHRFHRSCFMFTFPSHGEVDRPVCPSCMSPLREVAGEHGEPVNQVEMMASNSMVYGIDGIPRVNGRHGPQGRGGVFLGGGMYG